MVRRLVRTPGFFLDIGSGPPQKTNNTYMLERIGWSGIMMDQKIEMIEEAKLCRKATAFCMDCAQGRNEWLHFLRDNNVPSVIDYMSVDIDQWNIQFIQNFPFDLYEFKVMTYETDCYKGDMAIKNAALNILGNYPQYRMLLDDARLLDNRIWEDWWVNEKYVKCKRIYTKGAQWKEFINKLEHEPVLYL